MRLIKDFVKDAGGWAVTSTAAAVAFFILGLVEHARDKSVSAFVLVCVSVPLWWIGGFVAWRRKHNQLAVEKHKFQFPSIDVQIDEVHFSPTDEGISRISLVVTDAFNNAHRGFACPPWKASGEIAMHAFREDTRRLAEDLSQRKAEEEPQNSVGSAEWREVADRFGRVSDHVSVSWQQTGGDDGPERWTIRGSTADEANDFAAMCSLAGTMLLKSRLVTQALSKAVLSQQNEADRWLRFLADNGALSDITYLSETLDSGEIRPIFLGSIREAARVSSRMCISCSAKEVGSGTGS